MEDLGKCPKCGAPMKRGLGFNPFGVMDVVLGPILGPGIKMFPKPVKCSKCGFKPTEWKGARNQ